MKQYTVTLRFYDDHVHAIVVNADNDGQAVEVANGMLRSGLFIGANTVKTSDVQEVK